MMDSPANSSRQKAIACYVTDRKTLGGLASSEIIQKMRIAVESGVDWIQIREKELPSRELLALARETVQIAATAATGNVSVVINDRLDVALAAGASGVHLGRESSPHTETIRWCRRGNAPPDFLIGISCHEPSEAVEAENSGASYVFFGPVYDTPSKRAFGAPQGVARLREVCRALRIPVIAIGGVSEKNWEEPMKAGARGIAAIRLFQESNSAESLQESLGRLHRMPLAKKV